MRRLLQRRAEAVDGLVAVALGEVAVLRLRLQAL
jgi:hypothetical protein